MQAHLVIAVIRVYLGGFPGGSDGKESACNAVDTSSIPGSGRSPGKGNALRTIIAAMKLKDTYSLEEKL